MSEERTNMAIRDLKHYVIDNMSLDVQDDFEIICKYITNLQQKVEQLENIRKEAIEYIGTDITARAFEQLYTNYQLAVSQAYVKIAEDLLNILNKGGISKYVK